MTARLAVPVGRRSEAERDRLVEQYLPLVRHVVGRMVMRWLGSSHADELYSAGVMGLIHAATTYDPGRGASFKTFAFTAIRGAILDEVRRLDPVPRTRRDRLRNLERATNELQAELGRPPVLEEIAEALDCTADELDDDLLALHTSKQMSLDDTIAHSGERSLGQALCDPSALSPGNEAERREQIDRLAAAIATLPETERRVVVLYYHEGLLLKEIGGLIGVTESRVCQLMARAHARLQLKMKED